MIGDLLKIIGLLVLDLLGDLFHGAGELQADIIRVARRWGG